MLATVLMATLAKEGWDRHLETLVGQTYSPLEVVVVVDRATSPEEQAALAAAHPEVRFVFNEANIGLTRSLNVGLRHARGEFIVRADDDDENARDRVAKQVAKYRETGADIVCAFARGVSEENPERDWLIDHPVEEAELKQALLRRNVIVHPAVSFRAESARRLGGYDESFRYAQDYGLYLAALRAGQRFAVVPEPLVTRLYSATSITVARRKQQMMYSACIRLLHAAENNDVKDFLATMVRRAAILLTPNRLRQWRRAVFQVVGRGA
jgi:glycosyltransferase involved in cell wall biosynthesis